MPRLTEYLSVGFCQSYGDADYKVACAAADLTPKEVQELRAMVTVAVGVLEGYLREAIDRHQPPAMEANTPPSDTPRHSPEEK